MFGFGSVLVYMRNGLYSEDLDKIMLDTLFANTKISSEAEYYKKI